MERYGLDWNLYVTTFIILHLRSNEKGENGVFKFYEEYFATM